ncbi:MAG: hypothetical protein GXP43_03470 [bacterium]|nr:hypothetical protein [bacterium]
MKKKIKFLRLACGLFLIFFGSFIVLGGSLVKAEAFFFDQAYVQNNLIAMGDWTAPESVDDISYPLPAFINSRLFDVYTISSDAVSRVVEVSLYYSYGNLTDYNFVLYKTLKSSQGDFIAGKDVNLKFEFNSPMGDGHYDLAIVAVDEYGNQESLPVAGGMSSNLISIDVDTTPPVTALSLGESDSGRFMSNDEEVSGGFEASDTSGWRWGGDSPSGQKLENNVGLAHTGEGMFRLGYDGANNQISTDYLEKDYILTKTSLLSFWWRYISEDYVDFDYFRVQAFNNQKRVKILDYGLDVMDPPYDTGWRESSYWFDSSWVGKDLTLRFEMKNSLDDQYPSKVLIDDVRFVPDTAHFIAETKDLKFMAKDASGSGVAVINVCLDGVCDQYSPDPADDEIAVGPVAVGQVQIDYWSQDDLGQTEATKSAVVTVKESLTDGMIEATDADFDKNIVLNQFLPNPEPGLGQGNDSDAMPLGEWVELYNRQQSRSIDVAGWYILDEAGNKVVLTADRTIAADTLIPPRSKLVFYLNKAMLNNSGDTVFLYNDNDVLIDKMAYKTVVGGKSWKREPDGFGGWSDPEVEAPTASQSGSLVLKEPAKPATPSAKQVEFKEKEASPAGQPVLKETEPKPIAPSPTPTINQAEPTPASDQAEPEADNKFQPSEAAAKPAAKAGDGEKTNQDQDKTEEIKEETPAAAADEVDEALPTASSSGEVEL